jgi:hypothetical protein
MRELLTYGTVILANAMAFIEKFNLKLDLFSGYINTLFINNMALYITFKQIFADLVLYTTGTIAIVIGLVKLYNNLLDCKKKRKENKIKKTLFN